jgi:biotin synthase
MFWFEVESQSRLTPRVPTQAFTPSASTLEATGAFQEELHAQAAGVASAEFGRRVFVRAVVEASNYCRQDCSYCGMRRDNRSLDRYRAVADQLAELLIEHRPASVTDVNIQTGEDPVAAREVVLPLVETLQRETSLGISVCLGFLDERLYQRFLEAGASTYILKFEMAGADRYERLQAPGTLHKRLHHIRHLAEAGWNVSSGFIAGLPGETTSDLLDNLTLARTLPLSGCSVSPFIPGDETPLCHHPVANIDQTLNCMAAMRLMQPDWVIPSVSALNLANPGEGYRRGLRTGANLVTINLTPEDMRGNYLLYKRDRYIMTEERILNAIDAEGLIASKESLAIHYASKPKPAVAEDSAALATSG